MRINTGIKIGDVNLSFRYNCFVPLHEVKSLSESDIKLLRNAGYRHAYREYPSGEYLARLGRGKDMIVMRKLNITNQWVIIYPQPVREKVLQE